MTEKEIQIWVKRLILFTLFNSLAIIVLWIHVFGG